MAEDWSGEQLAALARTELFREVPEERLRRAAEDPDCLRERFPKGTVIYSPSRFRRCLGVFLSGRARVTKGALVMSTLERGAFFGAAALFHRRDRYETTITALTPCTVAFFPEELVAALLDDCPAFRRSYIAYLSERIHFLSRKVEGLTAPKVTGKLARWLLESEREEVSCPATELSRRLDVSRASLYRAFEELEGAGAIRRAGKTIVILDRRVLEIQNGGT
ncbi:Crp/Fnr family transcriptional regulator [uncultured Intestinimonas sp.]|uniref:Crp/Fnr family transcriptional regulator n=1 Tax=uncultured Intestinimonas sp. TaxID=1689265 RepID=UPI0025E3D0ED|nr:Crp/Fnr family transcriptional regulator [uncultured Intestinimonas sp.]